MYQILFAFHQWFALINVFPFWSVWSRVRSLSTGDFGASPTQTTRAAMARKPRRQDTGFSWRWVPLWVYYNFVIKISRKKHTQAPSSLPSGREESLSGEKNLSEAEQGRWGKKIYESGRGRRRRRRRRRGEQIKSCQMEILGFKRSETGVKGFASLSRLYVMLIGDKYLWLDAV